MAKHIMYTYDRCAEERNMLGTTTITSNRNVIHYCQSDYVLTPLWCIMGSNARKQDKKYQITQIKSVDDMHKAGNAYSLLPIKTIQNNGHEVILKRMNFADYSFQDGQRNFGFTKDSIVMLAEDDSYNIYVVKKNDQGGKYFKLKTQSIASILAVPCENSNEEIVYTKYFGENKKMINEVYGTSCTFDRIRGYNDKHIYFERSQRTYVIGFDLRNAENFNNIFKKYKGIRPYYIDFSDDTIYYCSEQEQVIRGYDLAGIQVDEWKIPTCENDEVLLFVGKRLFVVLGRVLKISCNDERVQDGYMREYDREGRCIKFNVIDARYGMAGGTYVDYIAGEPCVLGGSYDKAVLLTINDATPVFKYNE